MTEYHDNEWGRPSRDERYLFEMLVLEGAQAGLSWSTILRKRDGYRSAMDAFDPRVIAGYDDAKLNELAEDPGIVRNRLKLRSAVGNARAFLAVQDEFGAFSSYLWGWVGDQPVKNHPTSMVEVPSRSALSDQVSADLSRRGFKFVGTTIVYSYLQAVGVIDDHLTTCPSKPALQPEARRRSSRTD
jgi:DNA-3-methyladenine glycosylase I